MKTRDLNALPWATGIFKVNLRVCECTGPKNNGYFYRIDSSKLLNVFTLDCIGKCFCKIDLDIFINLDKSSGCEQSFNCLMNYALCV